MLEIIAVGTLGKGYQSLCVEYQKRLKVRLKITTLDIKANNSFSHEEVKAREEKLIRKAWVPESYKIALDAKGTLLDSPSFSKLIFDKISRQKITLVIGGAFGLSATLLQDFDTILSFGRFTWPHQMVQLMLIEQLYRAEAIYHNHPYHK